VGPCEAAGYIASGLVIMAFCMKDLMYLRLVALASNVAFLIYGIGLGLAPVWVLHAILLPVNIWRLSQQLSGRSIGAQMRHYRMGARAERAQA
jgi:CRP/FNR family cyclic AMP-dependent transcriptional regulator